VQPIVQGTGCGTLAAVKRPASNFTPSASAGLSTMSAASSAKREDGRYFLVTPVEKVGIIVDDVPFVAVNFAVEGAGDGQGITFVTQVDAVAAGPEHPIRVAHDPETGEPAPTCTCGAPRRRR
jgi:hypothetical protein